MIDVLAWIALEELLAWSWFVLAWPLFAAWPDRGLGVSKAVSILLLTAPSWTLAWLTGIGITPVACWTGVALIVAGAAARGRRHATAIAAFLAGRAGDWGAIQALWALVTTAFLLLRAMRPDIAGGEKFMDFALLNAAFHGAALPIEDPWLAGFPLNYYHFGFVTWAAVARMTGTPPAIAYNLASAMLPGLVAAAAGSIAFLLAGHRRAAVLSAVALVGLGNLAGAGQLTSLGAAYDIWTPTRVIPGTINEFPFFTFLWADLHPHAMAMPNVLVFVALGLVALADPGPLRQARPGLFALLGVSGGIAAATSPWDLPGLGLLLAAVCVARISRMGVAARILELSVFVVAALVIALPSAWSASAGGVHVGRAITHSPLPAFLLVHAGWLLPPVLLLGLGGALRESPRLVLGAIATIGCVGGALTGSVTVGAVAILSLAGWEGWRRTRSDLLLLIAAAATQLLLAETFYVDDIYGAPLARMNIVFKLHLQAILLLGLVAGACVLNAWNAVSAIRRNSGSTARAVRVFVAVSLIAVTGLSATYPIGALLATLGQAHALTLDGMAGLARDHPADWQAIAFLAGRRRGRPVIVEATDRPYSYASRISVHTGLPAILGWANHEYVWRRSPAMQTEIARRADAVRTVYEGDRAAADRVLRAYRARYVIVGDLERQIYPAGNFAKFETLGRQVFAHGGTTVFELDEETTAP